MKNLWESLWRPALFGAVGRYGGSVRCSWPLYPIEWPKPGYDCGGGNCWLRGPVGGCSGWKGRLAQTQSVDLIRIYFLLFYLDGEGSNLYDKSLAHNSMNASRGSFPSIYSGWRDAWCFSRISFTARKFERDLTVRKEIKLERLEWHFRKERGRTPFYKLYLAGIRIRWSEINSEFTESLHAFLVADAGYQYLDKTFIVQRFKRSV